ncbi:MAG: ATP-binding protein, partial [Thermodesulfobacteriota bacterium]|nr:ATP-binding protein [Thermodesulfobacteriota bacterium]
LSPLKRFDLEDIELLIDQEKYFILHAPRQTGKTTSMLALMKYLNLGQEYLCLYINIESAQTARENVKRGMSAILSTIAIRAGIHLKDQFPARHIDSLLKENQYETAILSLLTSWCSILKKPLVLIIDEVDSLVGDTLISLLRQIRSGYDLRPENFPHSIILCGVRDIRDYRIYSDKEKSIITGGSAFNIKAKSLRLGGFTENETAELMVQHEQETGQKFTANAKDAVWYYTNGQPWLVNALCYETCFEMKQGRDRSKSITKEMMDQAKENLILRSETHLDQLADKLTEVRVANIIETILVGENDANKPEIQPDDRQYLIDLGLIRQGIHGLEIANPIYREVIPRELILYRQDTLGQNPAWYIKENGRLDINKVIEAYIEFYKEHSELVTKRKTYTEAAHHLLFMAWLQRIVNSGGIISREYAAGLGRLDLCIEFADERFAFELKLSSAKALERGRRQLAGYLDRLSLNNGWLVIFSRSEVKDWEKVGKREQIKEQNKEIEVIWL